MGLAATLATRLHGFKSHNTHTVLDTNPENLFGDPTLNPVLIYIFRSLPTSAKHHPT